MNWVEETLKELGRSLGIEDLGFNANGVCALTMERRGTFYIELAGEDVLLYLVREVPRPSTETMRKALSLSHFDRRRPFPVKAGLIGETLLLFIARIASVDFSLPAIDRAIGLLTELHESVVGD